MDRSPQILLFDLGGVLIRSVHFEALRELMKFDGSDQTLREMWLQCRAVRAFERGKISPDEFGSEIVKELRLSIAPSAFLSAFQTWPQGFYDGARDLISKLRESYRVGCLSNSNPLHWTAELDAEFDFAYSSHLTGHMKPDAIAFEHVVVTQRSEPEAIAFFDDSLVNVRAARSARMIAHHTVGYVELVTVLEREGLLR